MAILRSVQAVRIFVNDLERSRAFYSGVLELEERSAEPTFAVYVLGEMEVIIEAVPPDDPEAFGLAGRFLAVSFQVDDINETYRSLLERGVIFVQPPEQQSWGGSLAFFNDPDGNVLTLVQ